MAGRRRRRASKHTRDRRSRARTKYDSYYYRQTTTTTTTAFINGIPARADVCVCVTQHGRFGVCTDVGVQRARSVAAAAAADRARFWNARVPRPWAVSIRVRWYGCDDGVVRGLGQSFFFFFFFRPPFSCRRRGVTRAPEIRAPDDFVSRHHRPSLESLTWCETQPRVRSVIIVGVVQLNNRRFAFGKEKKNNNFSLRIRRCCVSPVHREVKKEKKTTTTTTFYYSTYIY